MQNSNLINNGNNTTTIALLPGDTLVKIFDYLIEVDANGTPHLKNLNRVICVDKFCLSYAGKALSERLMQCSLQITDESDIQLLIKFLDKNINPITENRDGIIRVIIRFCSDKFWPNFLYTSILERNLIDASSPYFDQIVIDIILKFGNAVAIEILNSTVDLLISNTIQMPSCITLINHILVSGTFKITKYYYRYSHWGFLDSMEDSKRYDLFKYLTKQLFPKIEFIYDYVISGLKEKNEIKIDILDLLIAEGFIIEAFIDNVVQELALFPFKSDIAADKVCRLLEKKLITSTSPLLNNLLDHIPTLKSIRFSNVFERTLSILDELICNNFPDKAFIDFAIKAFSALLSIKDGSFWETRKIHELLHKLLDKKLITSDSPLVRDLFDQVLFLLNGEEENRQNHSIYDILETLGKFIENDFLDETSIDNVIKTLTAFPPFNNEIVTYNSRHPELPRSTTQCMLKLLNNKLITSMSPLFNDLFNQIIVVFPNYPQLMHDCLRKMIKLKLITTTSSNFEAIINLTQHFLADPNTNPYTNRYIKEYVCKILIALYKHDPLSLQSEQLNSLIEKMKSKSLEDMFHYEGEFLLRLCQINESLFNFIFPAFPALKLILVHIALDSLYFMDLQEFMHLQKETERALAFLLKVISEKRIDESSDAFTTLNSYIEQNQNLKCTKELKEAITKNLTRLA